MKNARLLAAMPGWSRRELLRSAGLTIAGLSLPALVSGCGDDGGGGAAPSAGGGTQAIPLSVDPNVPWWLQNGFGPVFDELDAVDLPTRGHIPPELNGLYVRNGSNPQS